MRRPIVNTHLRTSGAARHVVVGLYCLLCAGLSAGEPIDLAVIADTHCVKNSGDLNFGASPEMWVYTAGVNQFTLLRFDLSAVPSIEIASGTLKVWLRTVQFNSAITLAANAMAEGNINWVEGSGGKWGALQEGKACYDYQQYDDVPWAGGGATSDLTLLSQTDLAGSEANMWLTYPITNHTVINAWLARGQADILIGEGSPLKDERAVLGSREFATPAVLTLVPAVGTVVLVH